MPYYCSEPEQQEESSRGRLAVIRMREQQVGLSHRKARNVSSPSSSQLADDTDNNPQEHYHHPNVTAMVQRA